MDTTGVEAYLSTKLLSQSGQPYTLTHLSSVLFHITQMLATTLLPVITAVQAVAFLLKKHTACEIAEATALQLSSTLAPQIIEQVITAIKPQMENICEATKNIKDGTQEPLDSLATTVEDAEHLHCMLKNEQDEQREDLRITAERCHAWYMIHTMTDIQIRSDKE
jgi:hypothetical protein